MCVFQFATMNRQKGNDPQSVKVWAMCVELNFTSPRANDDVGSMNTQPHEHDVVCTLTQFRLLQVSLDVDAF